MEVGKLPHSLLEKLLTKIPTSDPSVILGPKIGEDAAVVLIGGKLVVAKSDPITFATANAGWYAVQINANDIACAGGVPKWFLATLLLPESIEQPECESLFSEIIDSCTQLNISLIGGHTEVTLGIDRPIILGTMLGEVDPKNLTYTGKAQEGDSIVLTKGISIEGTSILARERPQELLNSGVSQNIIDRSTQYLTNPGISVVADAKIALESVRVHSMHDPTEGGLATALAEIATASTTGVIINKDAVPVFQETAELCATLRVDPWGLISSGALLITARPERASDVIDAVNKTGTPAVDIGEIRLPEDGLMLRTQGVDKALPMFDRDELARVLAHVSRP